MCSVIEEWQLCDVMYEGTAITISIMFIEDAFCYCGVEVDIICTLYFVKARQ